jgi:putative DNA primase/helicase
MLYSPVPYRPDWSCPQYEKYLQRSHPGDTLALLDAIDGYSASGLMEEEVFVIHYGEGTNGKSVYAKIKRAQHGSYLQVIPQKTLLAKRGDGVPNDIMRLRGKRFGITSETAEGKRLDEAVIKGIASGDPIVARFLFGEYEEFQPVIKMHLLTNKLPQASNTRSMRRRGWVIPWNEVIPPDEIDKKLSQKIIERELPGVQARTMKNFRQWRQNGFPKSETAEAAVRNWLADQDTYHRFVEEVIDRTDDSHAYVLPRDVWNAWQVWTLHHGVRLDSDDAALFQALEEHGIQRADGRRNVPSPDSKSGRSHMRVFAGIRLREVTW